MNDGVWIHSGIRAIDTSNANSWETTCRCILARSFADVAMLQETKRFTQVGISAAKRDARVQGWNAHLSAAHPTSGHSGSGGCAVLVRAGSGITAAADTLVRDLYRHRIAVAWVDGIVKGGVHCVSVYLRDSEGLTPANIAILDELAVVVRSLRGPWIIAADWNLQPQTLADSLWPELVGGVVFATTLPTCNDSTYDYFVVQRDLASSVVGVQRIEDGGMHPHFSSRLFIRGDARRYAVRRLIK